MTRLGLRPLAVVVVALAAMAAGIAGTDAAILARRHYGPPPVTRPVPAPNPSPVLTASGGAR